MVEVAPPGAAEDHRSCWDMQTQDHHFCCICVCSSCQSNNCEPFFLQCSSLERASRSLAKTGSFLCPFRCFFLGHALECLWGPFGGHWVDFGGIWGAFWDRFGDFFRAGWVFENVCFIIVKPYFLRFGRILDRDFFVLCFWIYTFTLLFYRILKICWLSGCP